MLNAAGAAEAAITPVSGREFFNNGKLKLVGALNFKVAQELPDGAAADVIRFHDVHAGAGNDDKLGHTFTVAHNLAERRSSSVVTR